MGIVIACFIIGVLLAKLAARRYGRAKLRHLLDEEREIVDHVATLRSWKGSHDLVHL